MKGDIMKLRYTRKGDYLYPNLVLPPEKEVSLDKYGSLRLAYIREHRQGLYWELLLEGKLNEHLEETDKTARERMDRIVPLLLNAYPTPDKAADPVGWTAHMNSLKNMAEESVLHELVYA